MPPALHTLSLTTDLLQRGFWLYVLDLRKDADRYLYVGRTGDNGHLSACDPISRLAMHLRTGRNREMLDRINLKREERGLAPLLFSDFDGCEFHAHGPIFPERFGQREAHQKLRDQIAPIEKKLADSLLAAGYPVVNIVRSKRTLDMTRWDQVKAAFLAQFPKLEAY